MTSRILYRCLLFVLLLVPYSVEAQVNNRLAILDEVNVDEKLGDKIPLDAIFATSEGDSLTLGELMVDDKPVLIHPMYYNCPMLCGVILESVFNVVDDLAWTPGTDYTIISFSIDPEEKHPLAAENKTEYLSDLGRPEANDGWHFLTGSEENIRRVTEALGFSYTQHEPTGQYVHPASIMFLSPDGTITRYLYGLEFNEFDLRNALYEAADGQIGSALDQVVLYCFQYDPASLSYVPVALNIMKVGGLATALFLGIFLGLFWLKEKRSSRSQTIEIQE